MAYCLKYRSQLTLLIAMLIGVQAVGVGSQVQCFSGDSCHSNNDNSCCDSNEKFMSAECCCGRSTTAGDNRADHQSTGHSSTCSCGSRGSSPATPSGSQLHDEVRQLLSYDSAQVCVKSTVLVVEHQKTLGPVVLFPAAKSGLNAMLCVWLT